jgi:hypothetical protein
MPPMIRLAAARHWLCGYASKRSDRVQAAASAGQSGAHPSAPSLLFREALRDLVYFAAKMSVALEQLAQHLITLCGPQVIKRLFPSCAAFRSLDGPSAARDASWPHCRPLVPRSRCGSRQPGGLTLQQKRRRFAPGSQRIWGPLLLPSRQLDLPLPLKSQSIGKSATSRSTPHLGAPLGAVARGPPPESPHSLIISLWAMKDSNLQPPD